MSVPVDLGRDAAAAAARAELADPIYRTEQPSLISRASSWVLERLSDLIDTVVAATPWGWTGLLILLGLLVLIAVLIWRGVGRVRRSVPDEHLLFGTSERGVTAVDYRRTSAAAAASGDWGAAVRDRVRATIRDLEERGVLEPQAGRTAAEAAHDAGHVLPTVAAGLMRGASLFDEIVYGRVIADRWDYERVLTIDDDVRVARPDRALTAQRADANGIGIGSR